MDNVEYSLYIVATPIGNMEDITLRALNCLKKVDFILCEDTRQSMKLLNHFGISKPLISYHKFNEMKISDEIIERLVNGEKAALISDAGTPLISDPGYVLIKKIIENNISFCVLPGANAVLPSIIKSGFSTRSFIFAGFLSVKKTEKRKELENFLHSDVPVILYVSPHELRGILRDIDNISPEANLCLNKELTKLYENAYRGTAHKILQILEDDIKGEYTLVIDANPNPQNYENYDDIEIFNEFDKLISSNISRKEALKEISQKTGVSKKELYSLLMKKNN